MVLETFVTNIVNPNASVVEIDLFTAVITFVIYLALIILLSKYLWNNVIVSLIPTLNRIDNIWQIRISCIYHFSKRI